MNKDYTVEDLIEMLDEAQKLIAYGVKELAGSTAMKVYRDISDVKCTLVSSILKVPPGQK